MPGPLLKEKIVSNSQIETGKPDHICPWFLAYLFDNPFRKWFHNPEKMLGPYVKKGMTVMDIGCGMGYFSIAMARLAGDEGKVYSVDIQPEMLDVTMKRAEKKGVDKRISPILAAGDRIEIEEKADFVLAFWMVHETPDSKAFFQRLEGSLSRGGKIFVAEPKFHVSRSVFRKELQTAALAGLTEQGKAAAAFSHSALLGRG
jgi:ubiquinone/menaquinone biosynthesis C-methylase UbiE